LSFSCVRHDLKKQFTMFAENVGGQLILCTVLRKCVV
jgi:hypothetical protein